MIRYSTQPTKGEHVLNDSPTSPIKTTKDVMGLEGVGEDEKLRTLQDSDAEDENE
jgi:hypothetical protein